MKKISVDQWWCCDICGRQFEHTLETDIYMIEGFPDMICEACYNYGTIWAIRRASVEKKLGMVE